MAVAASADAQIMYTDITPDVQLTAGQSYTLDMDGTMGNDFGFNVVSATYYSGIVIIDAAMMSAINSANQWVTESYYNGSSTFYLPAVLSSGIMVSSSASLGNSSGTIGAYVGYGPPYSYLPGNAVGNWPGKSMQFIGVEFAMGGSMTHYGWVRLSYSADGKTLTIHDYAWNATPSGPILTGQTVGVDEETGISVNITYANNLLMVQTENGSITGGNVEITNLAGQIVENSNLTSNNETFSLESLTQGVYLVSVKTDKVISVEKVYIK